MPRPFATRDLGPIGAAALTAMVVLAVFAWTERTAVVDPDGLSVASWPWRLWQIAPLVIAVGGVWSIWLGTARVAWLRCLALALLVLAVLINAYTGGFGDHAGNVWRTLNPLYIAGASVAAASLCRRGGVGARAGAAVSAGLGAVVFVNGYFVDELVIWRILNPLMMLSGLAWAAGAGRVDVGTGERAEPG